MGRKDSHLVKSLDIARVSASPFSIRAEFAIEWRLFGGRGIQRPEGNYVYFRSLLTDVTHLEFFDALDFIWIVRYDRVDPLPVTVTLHLLGNIGSWLRC